MVYSPEQLRTWAHLIQMGKHASQDTPPDKPFFRGKVSRDKHESVSPSTPTRSKRVPRKAPHFHQVEGLAYAQNVFINSRNGTVFLRVEPSLMSSTVISNVLSWKTSRSFKDLMRTIHCLHLVCMCMCIDIIECVVKYMH